MDVIPSLFAVGDERAITTTLGPFGIALIAFLSAVVPGIFTQWFASHRRTKDKEEDWKRQDDVAKQAAEAARLLIERQALDSAKMAEAAKLLLDRQELESLKTAEAARLLLASNERVAANATEVNKKLGVIHELVNSKMTEAMQNELDSKVNELALMLKYESSATGAIKSTQDHIAELRARMDDRLKQQAAIDAKQK